VKVLADESVCAGCGQCVVHAPAVFDQSADLGVVMVLDANPPAAEWENVKEATHRCPTQAIRYEDD
jgi:ferredoxin